MIRGTWGRDDGLGRADGAVDPAEECVGHAEGGGAGAGEGLAGVLANLVHAIWKNKFEGFTDESGQKIDHCKANS